MEEQCFGVQKAAIVISQCYGKSRTKDETQRNAARISQTNYFRRLQLYIKTKIFSDTFLR
jgi:hypothetical protein